MSGSFLDMDVPPTLISFAVAPAKTDDVLSPEFKEAGHPRLPARARLGRRRRLQGLLGRLCRPARRRQGEGRLGRGKQRGRSDHEHVVRQRHRL